MVKEALNVLATKSNIWSNLATIVVSVGVVVGYHVQIRADIQAADTARSVLSAQITQVKTEHEDYREYSTLNREAFQTDLRDRIRSIELSLKESQTILERLDKRP